MKKLNSLPIFFTLILLLLVPNLAAASFTSEAGEISYQINNSDRIVIGTVSRVDMSSAHMIATITVNEWLYNSLPTETIKVRSGIGTNVASSTEAEFIQNESVLLMLNDVNLDQQLFRVSIGSPGKHPVSDREAVIKELKAQGKWQDKNQTVNKTNDEGNGLSNNADEPINIPIEILVIKCTHEDLDNYSDMIVIGTVREILPSKWNTIDGKQPNKSLTKLIPGVESIYTDIIISVDKYLKNPIVSQEVIVRTIGGTVGKVSMKSDVEARFKPDEKVLLYLSKDTSPNTFSPEHFWVTGSLQGKFTLTDDGKAIRPDENTTLDELLSTIKQTDNKTNDTKTAENTGTVDKQEENSNSTRKPNTTPFISPLWMLAALLGAVTYVRRKK